MLFDQLGITAVIPGVLLAEENVMVLDVSLQSKSKSIAVPIGEINFVFLYMFQTAVHQQEYEILTE